MAPGQLPKLGALLFLCGSVTACQHFERIGECRQVSALVNPVLASIDASRRRNPVDARTYQFIGLEYDTLAGTLAGLHLKTRHLGELVGEYQKVLRAAAHDSRIFASALDRKDASKLIAVRNAGTRAAKQESSTVSRIESFCRGN